MNNLIQKLKKTKTIKEKLDIIEAETEVQAYCNRNHEFLKICSSLELEDQYFLKVLIVIKQAEIIFSDFNDEDCKKKINILVNDLKKVENFYHEIGGIVGYHQTFLELVNESKTKKEDDNKFFKPEWIDIRQETDDVKDKIKDSIDYLDKMACIFPLGGAADRLNLIDEKTKEHLPASMLNFQGVTLLEHLIRDVEALENLYYLKHSKKIVMPIVIMTSSEKNNHELIQSVMEENNHFRRPKDSFFLIRQISVPVIAKDGGWIIPEPLSVTMKPSGHGAIWKLMHDEKVFEWLKSKNIKKALIRQINNPIAGIDYGLLAFMGYGISNNKKFGFSACPRLVGSAQGMNVFKQKKITGGYQGCITNIEYVSFKKYNIDDEPVEKSSNYSEYPANTNILFADLDELHNAVKKEPFPGKILNFKHDFLTIGINDEAHKKKAGRIELMMQNIADTITDFSVKENDQKNLSTYLTYNKRVKTISAIKKAYRKNEGLMETPQGTYYDLLCNYYELFSDICKMKLPTMPSEEEFIENGPSFIISYHPFLGPLYSIIKDKIKNGVMNKGSELLLRISDILLEKINLEGSLQIFSEGMLENEGKCILKNVKIQNDGINYSKKNVFWENHIYRNESCIIVLHHNSEFIAENVLLEGDYHIEVPKNCRITAYKENDRVHFKKEKIIDQKEAEDNSTASSESA